MKPRFVPSLILAAGLSCTQVTQANSIAVIDAYLSFSSVTADESVQLVLGPPGHAYAIIGSEELWSYEAGRVEADDGTSQAIGELGISSDSNSAGASLLLNAQPNSAAKGLSGAYGWAVYEIVDSGVESVTLTIHDVVASASIDLSSGAGHAMNGGAGFEFSVQVRDANGNGLFTEVGDPVSFYYGDWRAGSIGSNDTYNESFGVNEAELDFEVSVPQGAADIWLEWRVFTYGDVLATVPDASSALLLLACSVLGLSILRRKQSLK